ncbi:MAG: hypothetical protein LC723_12415, partial [Actinobacteria bacterium]|nr:hypothetical protein [Actinomycetota bacterium]
RTIDAVNFGARGERPCRDSPEGSKPSLAPPGLSYGTPKLSIARASPGESEVFVVRILDISRAHTDAPEDALVLAHTDFQPSSTHLGAGGSLVPIGWDFAGAISREWHIGMVLDSWCALPNEQINEKAARAIIEGYTSIADDVPPLDVSIFSPVITAWLNWLVSRMNVALEGGGRAKEHAEREVADMLTHPKDRNWFERVLRATGA